MPLSDTQKQQLVDVYRRAESSGDSAAMERIRETLRADREGTAAPASNEISMMGMFQANAEQNREVSEAVASGTIEAPKRVAGGLKQFAGGLQDMYNMFVKGKPYYNPETREYLESSAVKQATVNEAARAKVAELEAADAGINPKLRDTVASIEEMAALTAATEAGIARGATTLSGNLIRQATASGAQSALQFDAEGNKGTDIIVGATAQGAFSALAGLSAAVGNMVARGVSSRVAGSRTEQAVANAQAVLPNFKPTLAQRTGIPEIKTLEQAAYNSALVKTYADQNDQMIQDIAAVLQQPVKPGQDLKTDFLVTKNVAQTNLDKMVQNRIALWNNGMANVKSLTPKTGPKNIPAQNLTQQYARERADMDNVLKNMGATKINGKARAALEGLLAPRNKLKDPTRTGIAVDDFADLLQGLTKLERETSDRSVRAFARRMRLAMDADVKNLASYNGPALPAVSELIQVRTEYQRASMAEKLMKDSVTYRLLGVGQKGTKEAPRPDQLVAKFQEEDPMLQREFRAWAEQNSPEILNTMRDKVIKDALQNSRTITEARDSQVSLEQLTDALFDKNRGFDLRSTGLWGPVDQAKFEGVREGLRVIANQRTSARGAGTAIKAEDVAINIISRSGPFVARQLARVFYGTKAANFLQDPRAYEYLTTIRKTSGSTQLAARMGLMELLQDEYDADTSPLASEVEAEVSRQRSQPR